MGRSPKKFANALEEGINGGIEAFTLKMCEACTSEDDATYDEEKKPGMANLTVACVARASVARVVNTNRIRITCVYACD